MLYWLFYETLFPHFSPFRIFGFITFRTLAASIVAFLIAVLAGRWFIRKMQAMQIGQQIRTDGPESHLSKKGTPTMGGLLILTSVIIPTLLFTNLHNPYVWVALFSLVGFGIIGFIDDYSKVKKSRSLGLTPRQKMLLQTLVMLCIGGWLLVLHGKGMYDMAINVPFFKNFRPSLLLSSLLATSWTFPLAFVLFFGFLWLVIVGSSNAVNLTDGLDGLAIGLMVIASGAMTVLSYVSGHAQFANYLGLTRLAGSAELTIFCASLTGASIGFLWFNAHPAEMFMGDVGALALGGSMGVVSVLLKQEILLLFIGGVYVVELLSVVIQVASFTAGEQPATPETLAAGWLEGLKEIRRIGANARYWTDSSTKIPLDVSEGEALAGMCVDFYGRNLIERLTKVHGKSRLGFLTPHSGTTISPQPAALFRGAPNPELATRFLEFLLSMEGQKLWGLRAGTPGGPEKMALRNMPLRRDYYVPENLQFAADPELRPHEPGAAFVYEPKYTSDLFSAIRFLIRAMCIDPHIELKEAWHELIVHNFPPEATAVFEELPGVDYPAVKAKIAPVLKAKDPVATATLAREISEAFRQNYLKARDLARAGR